MGSTGKSPSQNNNQQQQESPLAVALRVAENRIYSGNTETAVLLDDDGNILFSKSDGLESSVNFTPEQLAQMVNKTLTHNHPSSTTFSIDDVTLLTFRMLKELRAVAANGEITYSLKRDDTAIVSSSRRNWFSRDYGEAYREYIRTVTDPMWAEWEKEKAGKRWKDVWRKELELSNRLNSMCAEFRRQWLKDNSKNYGYKYTEEKGVNNK